MQINDRGKTTNTDQIEALVSHQVNIYNSNEVNFNELFIFAPVEGQIFNIQNQLGKNKQSHMQGSQDKFLLNLQESQLGQLPLYLYRKGKISKTDKDETVYTKKLWKMQNLLL